MCHVQGMGWLNIIFIWASQQPCQVGNIPHFTDKETKIQRHKESCPHSQFPSTAKLEYVAQYSGCWQTSIVYTAPTPCWWSVAWRPCPGHSNWIRPGHLIQRQLILGMSSNLWLCAHGSKMWPGPIWLVSHDFRSWKNHSQLALEAELKVKKVD